MRHQRLLGVSEIQGLRFTVILDQERQAITVVSQSGRDGTLQVTELNSGVGTGGYKMEAKESVRNFVCG